MTAIHYIMLFHARTTLLDLARQIVWSDKVVIYEVLIAPNGRRTECQLTVIVLRIENLEQLRFLKGNVHWSPLIIIFKRSLPTPSQHRHASPSKMQELKVQVRLCSCANKATWALVLQWTLQDLYYSVHTWFWEKSSGTCLHSIQQLSALSCLWEAVPLG